MKASRLFPSLISCVCEKPDLRVVSHTALKEIRAIRCETCGRQAPSSVDEPFIARNWNQFIADEAERVPA